MQRILVVDDDHVQVDVVSFLLRREGFEPVAAYDAPSATRLFAEQHPDLVILDVNLGDADGRDLLRQFRIQRPRVFILMLTALGGEQDRVGSLELGADDYLTKPFGHREFLARVHALLRRAGGDQQAHIPSRLQLGSLVLDPATREVTRNGRPLDLSPTEFRLLQTLLEHPDQLVPTRTLLKIVWGHEDMTARNVVRVTASRLRAKLHEDPSMPPMLQTVAGEGLMIRNDNQEIPQVSSGSAEQAVAMDVVRELQELMAGTDDHPLHQLNDVFVGEAAKHIQLMREALARSDARALQQEAHRLRGSSASMGAQRVTSVCASIEECSRHNELDAVTELLAELERELNRYETAIAPMLD